MNQIEVIKAIMVTAEIYGKQFSEAAARMFLSDLSNYDPSQIVDSLATCRKELRNFPSVSEVIARIPDGRPGLEEAWANIPKDERQSIVWTEEMAAAYGVAAPLIADGDSIGARMAFKETYTRLVSDARRAGRKAVWTPSLGHDVTGRREALEAAVDRKLIGNDEAQALLPGPPGEISHDVVEKVREIIKVIEGNKA